MKKFKSLLVLGALVLVGVVVAQARDSDVIAVQGNGTAINTDVFRIDSNYAFHIASSQNQDTFAVWNSTGGVESFAGDVVLKGRNARPASATSGTFPGYKVQFWNGSQASTAQGSVLVASTTAGSTFGSSGMVSLTATTTVMGIADGVYTDGTVGYMTVGGYALVLTTGNVKAGDILVSSGTWLGSTGTVGFAGAATGTTVVGTVVGKALTSNGGTFGTVLAIIGLQ